MNCISVQLTQRIAIPTGALETRRPAETSWKYENADAATPIHERPEKPTRRGQIESASVGNEAYFNALRPLN